MENILITSSQRKSLSPAIVLAITLFAMGVAFSPFIDAVDWHLTFYPASKMVLAPYSVAEPISSFVNLPWLAVILMPFSLFTAKTALAINTGLSVMVFGVLVLKRGGNHWSLLLLITSAPFLALLANGTIEWVMALGFLLPAEIGLILLAIKPQSGGMVGLHWFMESKNKLTLVLPLITVFVVSFLLWGFWPVDMLTNIQKVKANGMDGWNWSLFPWLLPVGIGLLMYITKVKSANAELLATISTVCIAPYFGPSSLAIPFALLASKHRRISIITWVVLWAIMIFSRSELWTT